MRRELVKLVNISKKFGDHTVLNDINITINKGEVCCILGENGAGKSTLMRILAGTHSLDSGEVYFEDEKVLINTPQKAQKLGIRMIFQEFQLVPELTVSQNIFLKNELWYPYLPLINQKKMDRNSEEILRMLQCDINAKRKVGDLGYAQRQMVEISRALMFKAKLIILDEPTSGLLESEVKNLFEIIRKLKEIDVAVVYISHNFEEIRKIADRVIVMRDAKVVEINDCYEQFSSDYFIRKMTGEDSINRYPRIKCQNTNQIFKVENLSNKKRTVKNVNINLNYGEIVGLAGLQGAGKTSVAEMIYGIEKRMSGKIYLEGKEVPIHSPWQARDHGMSYISEYVVDNIFPNQNISFNLTITKLKDFAKKTFINKKKIEAVSRAFIEKIRFKIPYVSNPVKILSKGNLQKLALSKLIFSSSKIIIMDEPSKDLDIPSKVALYNIMSQLAKKGTSILLISSDMEELIGMCDRIYIMFNGAIVKELNASCATSAKILYYASGEND